MSLTSQSVEQLTRNVFLPGPGGQNVRVAGLLCSYTPDKSVMLHIEIADAALCAANLAEMRATVEEFMGEAFARAAQAGLPVPARSAGEGK